MSIWMDNSYSIEPGISFYTYKWQIRFLIFLLNLFQISPLTTSRWQWLNEITIHLKPLTGLRKLTRNQIRLFSKDLRM